MMRGIALAVALVLLAAALFGVAVTGGAAWPLAIFPAMMLIGLLVERHRYKPLDPEAPGADWQRTGETFIDPESGRPVTVYHEPRTGERRYVEDRGKALQDRT